MSDRSDRSRSAASKSREADSTATMERPAMDHWAPSSTLAMPFDKTGEYSYRWIAEQVNGSHMSQNVSSALREGYVRVMISELPETFICDEDRGDGYARQGGLILMRIPKRFAEQRQKYYSDRSASNLEGANALQGVAGKNAVYEDRGTRTLTGSEAGAALRNMSS